MASQQDDAVLPGEDLSSSSQDEDEDDVVDDDEYEDEELENEDDAVQSVSPSTPSAAVANANAVTIALPAAPKGKPSGILATTVVADHSGSDRRVIDPRNDAASAAQAPEEKKPALDDSRKLFQRLWTDEDEIELLQGFLDYTAQRGKTTHHGQNDTALFYDQIKSKLQLDFNKNQLVEKLRRLKKKYRNVVNKISSGKEFSFKSSHDQATFEISRKIWSDIGRIGGADDNALEDDDPNPNSNANFNNIDLKGEDAVGFSAEKKTPPRSRKRSRSKSDPRTDERRCFSDAPAATIKDNCNNGGANNHSNGNVQGLIEETVRSCLSPLLKELLSNAMGGPSAAATATAVRGFGGLALNPMPLSFGIPPLNLGIVEVADERWRKQQILELEVYSKRLELVQDQIKEALDELRSKGGS